jgi:hypothetical protein
MIINIQEILRHNLELKGSDRLLSSITFFSEINRFVLCIRKSRRKTKSRKKCHT